MIDRKAFFAGVRQGPFPGKLSAGQVNGITAILDEWDRRKLSNLRCLAYMLGTTKWETDHTMQPIREAGGVAYLTRNYDPFGSRPALAKRNGNTQGGDGVKYCGRGYVQLTWKNNYRAMGKLIGQPLEENPDLAMRPDIAAQVLFEGMSRGSFTGKKLTDYFNASQTDWIGARRIINGTDRAAEISSIAKQFYADLRAA
jgi:putative chitinase